jgi:hypothetical protein
MFSLEKLAKLWAKSRGIAPVARADPLAIIKTTGSDPEAIPNNRRFGRKNR